MTSLSFNLRLIVLSCILSIGLVLVYFSLLREAKELKWFKGNTKIFNYISLPILIIFILIIIIPTLSSLASKKDPEQRITIVNICEDQGFGGFKSLSSYSLSGITDSGEEITIYVSVLMPIKFKNIITSLSIGDVVYIKYTKNFNFIYFCEKRE